MQQQHQLLALLVAACSLCCLMAASVSVAGSDYSYAKFDDVEIYINCTYFKCDKIMCTNDTDRCHVSKQSSAERPTVLVRTNICYSATNQKLLESVTEETISATKKISFQVDTYRSGFSTSQENSHSTAIGHEFDFDSEQVGEEVRKNFDFHFKGIDEIHRNVQSQVNKVNDELQQQMKDLQQQMSNSFSNLFS